MRWTAAALAREVAGSSRPILLKYSMSERPFLIARFSGWVLAQWFGDI